MPIRPIKSPSLLPIPGQSGMRPMFRSLGIAASGLSVQRQRMESIAQNIANADVTRGADGQPYKRREVVLEAATAQNAMYGDPANGAGPGPASGNVFGTSSASSSSSMVDGPRAIEVPVLPRGMSGAGPGSGEFGVRVAGIAEDQGEGRLEYQPGHPDADAIGYVRFPGIDVTQENVNMLDAKRMFEANAAVFQVAKSILRASLDI